MEASALGEIGEVVTRPREPQMEVERDHPDRRVRAAAELLVLTDEWKRPHGQRKAPCCRSPGRQTRDVLGEPRRRAQHRPRHWAPHDRPKDHVAQIALGLLIPRVEEVEALTAGWELSVGLRIEVGVLVAEVLIDVTALQLYQGCILAADRVFE